jgi:predicted Fe-Mo cluster-binding NifX family protein
MKIAIPTADGKLCLHFGHCQTFTLIEADRDSGRIQSVESHTPPPHEPGVLPRWLAEQGADVILAGGMGRRAQSLFAAESIEVVVGAPALAPEQLARDWLAGRLEVGGNVCDH